MADKVDLMAARLERSRGWVIKQALSAWLAQEEERNRLMLEALDDVTSTGYRPSGCTGLGGQPQY